MRRDLMKVLHRVVKDACVTEAGSASAALEACGSKDFDFVFLDIRMPQKSGLELVQEIRQVSPSVKIIIVTAYSEYALDAFRLFVNGYILKPVMEEEVREVFRHYSVKDKEDGIVRPEGLYVQCFGSFEVFYEGRPLPFTRSQSKELFAYLIDRRGATATNAECRAILWEDVQYDHGRQTDYFHHVWADLKSDLSGIGYASVLLHSRNAYSVNTEALKCDYYDWLAAGRIPPYSGEYMSQYSWAEGRLFM